MTLCPIALAVVQEMSGFRGLPAEKCDRRLQDAGGDRRSSRRPTSPNLDHESPTEGRRAGIDSFDGARLASSVPIRRKAGYNRSSIAADRRKGLLAHVPARSDASA